ncbi:MAG: MFS transporter [Chitinophagaceae bacterium]|nr:MAG: MFS transporter [Chitinophagaceae bacterium]
MKLKKQLFPLFITVFLDLLGMGIVIPIAAPLLLSANEKMLPSYFSFGQRSFILGLLLGIFSVLQFFGAPVLGALADKYGRKRLLLLSIGGTCLSYLLFAIGIMRRSILLCFFSRALDGFTGGNISIAMSVISDITEEKDRAKNFGLIGVSFGLGFILGPFVSGILMDTKLVSWFNYTTPYWFAFMLSFVNVLILQFLLKETLIVKSEAPIKLFTGVRNLRNAFKTQKTRSLFITLFMVVFGFNFFTQFFQVFLIYKFSFSASNIAYLFAYIGLWLAFSQGVVNPSLSRRYNPQFLVSWSTLICALTFPFLLLPGESWWIYLIVPFVALFNGINTPNLAAVISFQADATKQGAILGIRQSILSIAMAIPPIIAGIITFLNINLSIWAAAFFTFMGWITFQFVFLRHGKR